MWLLASSSLKAFCNRAAPAPSRVVARGDAVGWGPTAIPVVIAAEVLDGRLRFLEGARRRSSEHLIEAYRRFAGTQRSLTLITGEPVASAALSGRVARNDRPLAAIAVAGHHTLVTRNVAHFRGMPDLRLENWIDEPLP